MVPIHVLAMSRLSRLYSCVSSGQIGINLKFTDTSCLVNGQGNYNNFVLLHWDFKEILETFGLIFGVYFGPFVLLGSLEGHFEH